jgi:predicted lipoprotein
VNSDARRSWGLAAGLTLAAVVRPACVPDDTGTENLPGAALEQVLADTWPHVVEPALTRAFADAEGLAEAAAAWSAAPADAGALSAAQTTWRTAMASWQGVEMLQIGPLGSSVGTVGGLDLRDEIYSWPTVNPCRVDQETVEASYSAPDFLDTSLVNVRGLDALETLLFSPVGENHCAANVSINLEGTWDALGTDEIQSRRAAYARVLADDIVDRIEHAIDAWDPGGGDFAGQLAAAGTPGSPYESADEALNALFDAAFYLETHTKDDKLGAPLGIVACPSESCLDLVETPLAGGSQDWIVANLTSFRTLFTGGEGAGMDDLLAAVGGGDVADRVVAALDEADVAAAALDVPVDDAATTDPTAAVAVYDALKEVTTLLQTDVAVILTLEVPAEAAGDND